jgi:hypothetical protein
MSEVFPLVPLHGNSPFVYLAMAAVVGVAFGYFLERSGFGSAKKLTAVFILRDWGVYRVMFTALVTAMVGAQVLAAMGLMELGLLEVGTTYLWPMLIGGLLFGVGFYFGGFCPGTAVVSAVRGRLDAWVFLVGIVLGIYGFAIFFDGAGQASWFQNFYAPADAAVQSLIGYRFAWVVAIAIAAGVMLSFRYLYIFEQRYALRTPEQLAGEPRPPVVRPRAGRSTRVVIGLAAALAVVLAVFSVGADEPDILAVRSELPAAVAVDGAEVPSIDSLSLAGWIVSDANRIAEEAPPNSHVLDLRDEQDRAAVPMLGTVVVPPGDDQYEAALAVLDDILITTADKNKPLVIVDKDRSATARSLVTELRLQGVNALLLDGGDAAWQAGVLGADAIWPEWIVAGAAGTTTSSTLPSMAVYQDQVRSWMTGTTVVIPAYLSIPGTAQLPSEAATVVATGGGGGGCG